MAYTATATAVAGRNGHVESSDGAVRFDLALPKELGGPGKPNATNPEQLFAAGYAACFGSAIDAVARAEKVQVGQVSVTAEVTLHKENDAFHLSARLRARIEGVNHETAQRLVDKAHHVCPYSKATRDNIAVDVSAA